jgi:hypothetical protein
VNVRPRNSCVIHVDAIPSIRLALAAPTLSARNFAQRTGVYVTGTGRLELAVGQTKHSVISMQPPSSGSVIDLNGSSLFGMGSNDLSLEA